MARYLSAEEVKKGIIAAFPANAGELYYELHNSVSTLQLNWQNYRALFGTSPERIDLLNWAASSFFGLLDDILRHDVFMHIARLSDPPQSVGRDNASIERLINELSVNAEATFIKGLRTKLKDFQEYCSPIRQLRNRILAHEDLATALQYHADPLPGISRAFVEDVLGKIRDIMNEIERKYFDATTDFRDIISQDDANSLISVLERAKEHDKCLEKVYRNKRGLPTEEG